VADFVGISLIFAVLLSSASAHAEAPDGGYWVADNDEDAEDDESESEWEKVEDGRGPVSKKRDQDWVKVGSKPEEKDAEATEAAVKEEPVIKAAVAPTTPAKDLRKTVGYVVGGVGGLCLLRGLVLQDRLRAGVVEGRFDSTGIADGKAETNLYITLGWVGLGAGAAIAFGPSLDGQQLALSWSGQW
jgi:hypothetical protein